MRKVLNFVSARFRCHKADLDLFGAAEQLSQSGLLKACFYLLKEDIIHDCPHCDLQKLSKLIAPFEKLAELAGISTAQLLALMYNKYDNRIIR